MRKSATKRKQQQRVHARIAKYQDEFEKALVRYETDHPDWQLECIFWLVEYALSNLKHFLEAENDADVNWASPFVQIEYPVELNWNIWRTGDFVRIQMNSGFFDAANTVNEDKAAETLVQILVKHLSIQTMHSLTNNVAFEKRGKTYTPIIPPEFDDTLKTLRGKKQKEYFLEAAFHPFSIGATCIDIDDNQIESGKPLNRRKFEELLRLNDLIDLPPFEFDAQIDGKEFKITLIFQIHQLIADVVRKAAFFPITVGLMLLPAEEIDSVEKLELLEAPWLNPENWSAQDRDQFWVGLFKALQDCYLKIAPRREPEVAHAIVSVNAKIKVAKSQIDDLSEGELIEAVKKQFNDGGEFLHFEVQTAAPPQEYALVDALKFVESASSYDDKGKALEELMVSLFNSIPGFEVTHRVRTATEEIDLVVSNSSDDPLFKKEGPIMLVECKNWSAKCGKNELVVFKEKILNRKQRCTCGFLVSWNGFADTLPKELLRGSREEALVLLLDGNAIRESVSRGSFTAAIKQAWHTAVTF